MCVCVCVCVCVHACGVIVCVYVNIGVARLFGGALTCRSLNECL